MDELLKRGYSEVTGKAHQTHIQTLSVSMTIWNDCLCSVDMQCDRQHQRRTISWCNRKPFDVLFVFCLNRDMLRVNWHGTNDTKAEWSWLSIEHGIYNVPVNLFKQLNTFSYVCASMLCHSLDIYCGLYLALHPCYAFGARTDSSINGDEKMFCRMHLPGFISHLAAVFHAT